MKKKLIRLLLVLAALSLACFACDEEAGKAPSADYSACEPAPIKNQKVVCNEFKAAIEDLCGFSLTIEPCSCVEEVADCTQATDWLSSVIDCKSSSDCTGYINCLEALGESPETDYGSCDNPIEWDCIVAAP